MSRKNSSSVKHTTRQAQEIAKISQDLNNPIYSTYLTTTNNYHRGYDYNKRRNHENGVRWDCSELSAAVANQQIKDMQNSGIQWKTNLNQIGNCFKFGGTTVSQRAALDAAGVPKIATGKPLEVEKTVDLKPGMVIYLRYPPPKQGGYSAHVATVTRNPETGELMISESIGGKNNIGVIHRSVHDFFHKGKAITNPHCQVTVYDPYHKDRDTLNKLDKQAENIRTLYSEAERAYKQGGASYRHVGVSENQNRINFISKFISNKIHSTPSNIVMAELNQDVQNNHVGFSILANNINSTLPINNSMPTNLTALNSPLFNQNAFEQNNQEQSYTHNYSKGLVV